MDPVDPEIIWLKLKKGEINANKLEIETVISTCILTHAGNTFDNRVTLTFDLLTSGSMHAEILP